MTALSNQHLDGIAHLLDGLTLTDQLTCLVTSIFSHIISAVMQNDRPPEIADEITDRLIAGMPQHWRTTRAIVDFHTSAPRQEETKH